MAICTMQSSVWKWLTELIKMKNYRYSMCFAKMKRVKPYPYMWHRHDHIRWPMIVIYLQHKCSLYFCRNFTIQPTHPRSDASDHCAMFRTIESEEERKMPLLSLIRNEKLWKLTKWLWLSGKRYINAGFDHHRNGPWMCDVHSQSEFNNQLNYASWISKWIN